MKFWGLLVLVCGFVDLRNSGEAVSQLPTSDRAAQAPASQEPSLEQELDSKRLREIVAAAYEEVYDGWSTDEVLLQPDLNRQFWEACQRREPAVSQVDCNWTLLNLRKAGLLKVKATRRAEKLVMDEQADQNLTAIAEIAARGVIDRHQVTLDRMLCDPAMRLEFDQLAIACDSDSDLYQTLKRAFQLRKQRQLRPELIARIADWGREIQTYGYQELLDDPDKLPPLPGIYIFHDSTGYLYLGQSDNLRDRLQTHFKESHNFSLSKYLADEQKEDVKIEIHSFPADSRAKETMVRRAYESELIASRRPRFNILP